MFDSLEETKRAIGHAVVEWNRVELMVAALAHRISGCIAPELVAYGASDVMYIALMNMDLRARINTTKAFAAKRDLYPGFYAEVETALGKVDQFRAERNSYVHSMWTSDFDRPNRASSGTKVKKPQAGILEVSLLTEKNYETPEHVRKFGDDLTALYNELAAIEGKVCNFDEYKAALAKR